MRKTPPLHTLRSMGVFGTLCTRCGKAWPYIHLQLRFLKPQYRRCEGGKH